ncbi:MAG: 3-octaprenyl-4-hydroxybenzoate decarboxylase [Gammaproteobacteria bacterium]|nr:MAG: 3-octaprenyl-4-hydroxybenzoate decarboxylase [Gammaproteobacteria bacterium]
MSQAIHSLRGFITLLEQKQQLKQITTPVDPRLEATEISDRVLRRQGPALLFNNPVGANHSLLTNLFGTEQRVAWGLGLDSTDQLSELGGWLAELREPQPPNSLQQLRDKWPAYRRALSLRPKIEKRAPFMENCQTGSAVDLACMPIQTCWPEDAAPLVTWAMVITRGPHHRRQNVGIYRMQQIGPNRLIMRWLAHRGGALDYQAWQAQHPEKPFPVTVAIGADPASMLASVMPIPDNLGEFHFAGLLREARTRLTPLGAAQLRVPTESEWVLEGHIHPHDTAPEGPFGDHTGYYNEVETFPVFTVDKLYHRHQAIYHSTHTGRPPDEPAILGLALNELYTPLLKKQFPEIVDFYLPTEACSYRMALVSINKQYPGHAKRIMFGIWSVLRQFMYTKAIIVVDADIDLRRWDDVVWALATRVDPARDSTIVKQTPIDYLDFASPTAGLGSKIGIDATNKWAGEVNREWGHPITMDPMVIEKVDGIWAQLGLD